MISGGGGGGVRPWRYLCEHFVVVDIWMNFTSTERVKFVSIPNRFSCTIPVFALDEKKQF